MLTFSLQFHLCMSILVEIPYLDTRNKADILDVVFHRSPLGDITARLVKQAMYPH